MKWYVAASDAFQYAILFRRPNSFRSLACIHGVTHVPCRVLMAQTRKGVRIVGSRNRGRAVHERLFSLFGTPPQQCK